MSRATVLDELAAAALRRAEEVRSTRDLDALYQRALLFEKRDFAGALSAPGLSVISEIKRASPSAGFIREAEAGTHADAVLLIAALFDAAALARYVSLAVEVGLTPLVEVHDEEEAELALESGARVIGVNNRDLRDFTVDLGTFERLAPRLAGATLVAESGVKTPDDAKRLRAAGAYAVLVGEAAMRDPTLVAKLSAIP